MNRSAEAPQSVANLVDFATEDAISRTNGSRSARSRVQHATERRLLSAVTEAHSIADQLTSSDYQEFRRDIEEYLGVFQGQVACPDGRIIVMASGDPKVLHMERSLEGMSDFRRTDKGLLVPGNTDNEAAIITYIEEERTKGNRHPEVVEFIGNHGNSMDPLEGCGGNKGAMVAAGHAPEISMRLGGISEYFARVGDAWNSYDNLVELHGGKGTTFDEWHDAYSQGFIYGLREAHHQFDENLSLRDNVVELAERGQILMTEQLAEKFRERIQSKMEEKSTSLPLDIEDYTRFVENAIAIGQTAMTLTKEEESDGFSWIPRSLKARRSELALRTLAYKAVRSAVYQVAAGIEPGNHRLLKHPEQLIRLGPIGADFNVKTIAFIQATSGGRLTDTDMARLDALYGLSYTTLKDQGVDLDEEGRIVRVTAAFNPEIYSDDRHRQIQQRRTVALLGANADTVRDRFAASIPTGETLVFPCIHNPADRKLTEIV